MTRLLTVLDGGMGHKLKAMGVVIEGAVGAQVSAFSNVYLKMSKPLSGTKMIRLMPCLCGTRSYFLVNILV